MSDVRIVFYTKPGCGLCEEAQAVLDELGFPYETAEDPAFAQRVPVVEVNGDIVAELRVSARAIKRAVARAREA